MAEIIDISSIPALKSLLNEYFINEPDESKDELTTKQISWLTLISVLLNPEEPDSKIIANIMKITKGKINATYLKYLIKEIKNGEMFKNLMQEIEMTKANSKDTDKDVRVFLAIKKKAGKCL